MELAQHFERFLKNISLDEPKLSRIKAEHENLRGALEADQNVRSAQYETFLQNSYVHGTAIRPSGKRTYLDVDVCCSLDLRAVPSGTEEPKRSVRWLAKRRKRIEAYRGKVSTRRRCVRIDFPGEFHMDVVPLAGDSNQMSGGGPRRGHAAPAHGEALHTYYSIDTKHYGTRGPSTWRQ